MPPSTTMDDSDDGDIVEEIFSPGLFAPGRQVPRSNRSVMTTNDPVLQPSPTHSSPTHSNPFNFGSFMTAAAVMGPPSPAPDQPSTTAQSGYPAPEQPSATAPPSSAFDFGSFVTAFQSAEGSPPAIPPAAPPAVPPAAARPKTSKSKSRRAKKKAQQAAASPQAEVQEPVYQPPPAWEPSEADLPSEADQVRDQLRNAVFGQDVSALRLAILAAEQAGLQYEASRARQKLVSLGGTMGSEEAQISQVVADASGDACNIPVETAATPDETPQRAREDDPLWEVGDAVAREAIGLAMQAIRVSLRDSGLEYASSIVATADGESLSEEIPSIAAGPQVGTTFRTDARCSVTEA